MNEPVQIFKCPCDKKYKYKLAGKSNKNPTLAEKRELGELISLGCSVLTISIEQFRSEKWTYCPCKI